MKASIKIFLAVVSIISIFGVVSFFLYLSPPDRAAVAQAEAETPVEWVNIAGSGIFIDKHKFHALTKIALGLLGFTVGVAALALREKIALA